MNLTIKNNDSIPNYELLYIKNEYSLYMNSNNRYIDFEISINKIDLTVVDKKIVQLSGFFPRSNWKLKNLKTPLSKTGELLVLDNLEPGHNYQVNKGKEWDVYYDETSGWICIGDPEQNSIGVEFIRNCVAVIENNKIKSLWLKPKWE